jgi:hypothetical protein
MTLDDFLKMVPGILGTVVAGCGVLVARRALSTWQRELKGKTEFDLARRTLLAVYNLRNAIISVRNDFAQATVEERLTRWREARANLNLCLLEAKVIWGDQLDDVDRQCQEVERIIWLAVIRTQRAEKNPQYNMEIRKKEDWEAIQAAASGDEEDEMGKKVSHAVRLFEQCLWRHLPTRSG